MVLERGNKCKEVEFKAEKWSGTNWIEAIRKLHDKEAILVTFADKPANFKREVPKNIQIIWGEEIGKLLKRCNLEHLEPYVDLIREKPTSIFDGGKFYEVG